MPKRSQTKRSADKEAGSGSVEEAPRAAKPNAILDEEENARALDEAAGVAEVRRSSLAPPPVTRPANTAPLLKADTREKLLYKLACTGTPLGSEFFDQFPDRQELLELSLDISARLLIVAICNSEMAPTQRIASMRVVAALAGKTLPSEEEQPAKPSSQPAVDARSAMASIDKIRQLTKMEQ
jgi:hypothetical protein